MVAAPLAHALTYPQIQVLISEDCLYEDALYQRRQRAYFGYALARALERAAERADFES